MEDLSSSLPTAKLPKRASPPLTINGGSILMDLKRTPLSPTSLIRSPTFRTQRSMALACSFTSLFLVCTMVVLFGNSQIHQSSKWLKKMPKNRPQVPSYFPDFLFYHNASNVSALFPGKEIDFLEKMNGSALPPFGSNLANWNATLSSTANPGNDHKEKGNEKDNSGPDKVLSKEKKQTGGGKSTAKAKAKGWMARMSKCDMFDGKWVKDDSPPLYEPGSCTLMDESFNCYWNGRPDNGYENLRWQPNHCNIPRLDGKKVLKSLRGKKIVYVGDSLSRNMWESMVCLLRNSVRDKSRVFEASGRNDLKKEGAYSFIFLDYNCSLEYFRSAFLVREWEMPLNNGSKKETLRLDLVEKSYDTFKDADVLIFNTGNWWTHEKTSEGKDYYQEGDHVHEKLDVVEAFNKAMDTWARWIKAEIDPTRTDVFFRGYSFSHFSKGEWNSGGRCDSKEPIEDEKDLLSLSELDPPIPQMLDKAMQKVKSEVVYLNVTRMTNYRRDAHPSLYRKPNMTDEEKRVFQTHQDCSHWCLPGVPDTWNQLLYAQLFLRHKQRKWGQQDHGTRPVRL